MTKIYHNDGNGEFHAISTSLPGVEGSAAWGDYDNDGRLDILLSGTGLSSGFVKLYHNDGNGAFHEVSTGIGSVEGGSVAWGDYDNDGRLDILLNGSVDDACVSEIYLNDGNGAFHEVSPQPLAAQSAAVAWGDYNRDGKLDALFSGSLPDLQSAPGQYSTNDTTLVYPNGSDAVNTVPDAPAGLTATAMSPTSVSLSWTAPHDAQTPAGGLTYNLRVGTTPGGDDIVAPPSDADGLQLVAQRGMIQGTTWTLTGLTPDKTYYWSVQAVDTSFDGSPFAAEKSVMAGAAISSVVVAEASTPKNGILESSDSLKITWAASSSLGIASQSVQIDGSIVTPINGPYGGLYYYCQVAKRGVGTHSYKITLTDKKGASVSSTGTFPVVAPLPPAISAVVVAEASTPKNGILESNEPLIITWAGTSSLGIAAQTLSVDGKATAAINGPYAGLYYGCTIGIQSAGSHQYVIAATDSKGGTFSLTGAFTVAASQAATPTVSSVVVAEAAAPKNGTLESSDQLVITWAATGQPAIASQSVVIDGRRMTTIGGPYSHLYYSCSIGARSAGTHTYAITATNTSGFSSTNSGTFSVAASTTVPVSIGSVVAAEAVAPRDGHSVADGIAGDHLGRVVQRQDRVADVDHRRPHDFIGLRSLRRTVLLRSDRRWSAGSHAYTITSTDSKGISATCSGTFLVTASTGSAGKMAGGGAIGRGDLLAAVMREMENGRGDQASDDLLDAVL